MSEAAPTPLRDTICATASGRSLDLAAPHADDVSLTDVAVGLSQLTRWAGQSRRRFSVAEHSLVVATLLPPELTLAGLLHDAHEAYCGDLIRPFERALAARLGGAALWAIRAVKAGIDHAIRVRVLADEGGSDAHVALLAMQMRDPQVHAVDDEAMRVEDAIRQQDSLSNGPSPAISRALELYGAFERPAGEIMLAWVGEVSTQARIWMRRQG